MIQYKLRQNTNQAIPASYGKWYAVAIINQTIDVDGLSEHMAAHNTPFSKGTIKGILTDAVSCIKEQILAGNAVKLDDLAIFKAGIVSKKGCEDKSAYKAAEYISGVRLRAVATGEVTSSNLSSEVTLKRAALDKDDSGDVEPDDVTAASGDGAAAGGDGAASGSEDKSASNGSDSDDDVFGNPLG
jgi:predicted histone-like DNA-binding protein